MAVTASRLLGSQRPDAVAPAHAPAGQPGRQPIGPWASAANDSVRPDLVLHGRLIGMLRGSRFQKLTEMKSIHDHFTMRVRLTSWSRDNNETVARTS